jgi:hypothetical protein
MAADVAPMVIALDDPYGGEVDGVQEISDEEMVKAENGCAGYSLEKTYDICDSADEDTGDHLPIVAPRAQRALWVSTVVGTLHLHMKSLYLPNHVHDELRMSSRARATCQIY